MSESTLQPKTEADDVSEDDKLDKPTNTKQLNTYNDTVLQIEDDAEEQKVSEAEILKQSVFRDEGLQSVYVIAGRGRKPRQKREPYDGDKYSNRQVWVQAMFGEPPSGNPMDEGSRGPFIRKVFGILFVCMVITSVLSSMSLFIPDVRFFFRSPAGLVLMVLAMIVLFPVQYAITCSDCARVPPCNFICLFIAVLCFSVFVMWSTSRYSLNLVFTALFVTTLVVLVCFALAFTPIDFTKFMIYVVVIISVLAAFSFVVFFLSFAFKQKFTFVWLILTFLMTLFQSIMFIIEIQMVIGGRTVELGEDDYVMGAYMLYTSIIELFLHILRLLALLEDLDI